MEQLLKTLPTILQVGGHSVEVVQAAAIAAWKYVAGEPLSHHASAIRLESKTLVVAVGDAVWQKQLETMRGQLLFRLNAIMGQPLVNRIEFRIGPSFAHSSAGAAMDQKGAAETNENNVSLELRSAANAIRDKQLRKVFLAAAAISLRRRDRKA